MDNENEDYSYRAVSRDQTPKHPASSGHNDQIREILWQNGQAVMQDKQAHKKAEDHHHVELIPAVFSSGSPPLQINHHDSFLQPQNQQNNDIANNNLFIQEEEMSTWLLSDFCSDLLLLPSSSSPIAPAPAPSTVIPHPARPPMAVPPPRRFENFGHFSRLNRPRATTAVEATVVDSNDTPMIAGDSYDAAWQDVTRVFAMPTSAGVRDASNCDLTVTSPSGASSASPEPIPPLKILKASSPPLPSPRKKTSDIPEEGKRIASGGEGGKRRNNGKEVEEGKKQVSGGGSSSKRSRAAEVHNLSERRRRDRINEKMRTLQEMIPHCNKADKASMLGEVIEHLKSLQMQLQMMSIGCGMMSMMYPYPGLQQFMPPMGMGLGMNGSMVQFPHAFSSSGGAGTPMGPRFPCPAFRMPTPIPAPNNQPDPVLSSVSPHNSNHPRMPGFMELYQQFLGLQHMHSSLHQANTSSSDLATTSKGGENSRKESSD